mmetsp:Transcript_43479/g.114587  ORF Transcript_43479/g.114587 Transcript_43479/m.114587 type:complete len:413 (-) Transcript_43479:65-1303(-)
MPLAADTRVVDAVAANAATAAGIATMATAIAAPTAVPPEEDDTDGEADVEAPLPWLSASPVSPPASPPTPLPTIAVDVASAKPSSPCSAAAAAPTSRSNSSDSAAPAQAAAQASPWATLAGASGARDDMAAGTTATAPVRRPKQPSVAAAVAAWPCPPPSASTALRHGETTAAVSGGSKATASQAREPAAAAAKAQVDETAQATAPVANIAKELVQAVDGGPPVQVVMFGSGPAYQWAPSAETPGAKRYYGKWSTGLCSLSDKTSLLCAICPCTLPCFLPWRVAKIVERVGAIDAQGVIKLDILKAWIVGVLAMILFVLGLAYEWRTYRVSIVLEIAWLAFVWVVYRGVQARFRVDEDELTSLVELWFCTACAILKMGRHVDGYYKELGEEPPLIPCLKTPVVSFEVPKAEP